MTGPSIKGAADAANELQDLSPCVYRKHQEMHKLVAPSTFKGPGRLQPLFICGSTPTTLTVTALLPVVSRHTVVTLGPRGAVFAVAVAGAVAPVVKGTHLVAVAL